MATITHVNVDMTGSEVEYPVPAGTAFFTLHAKDGSTTVARATGGTTWTLNLGDKETENDPNTAGTSIFLTGTNGHVVEVRLVSGISA